MMRIYPSSHNVLVRYTYPGNFQSNCNYRTRNESIVARRKNARSTSRKNYWSEPPEISIVGVSRLRDDIHAKIGKLIWLCAICIGVGVCFVQLRTCTEKFLEQPVVQHVNIVRDLKVKFPALYLCPGMGRNLHYLLTNKKQLKKCKEQGNFSCFNDPLAEAVMSIAQNRVISTMDQRIAAMWEGTYLTNDTIRLYKPCKATDDYCTVNGREWFTEMTYLNTFWGGCVALDTVVEEDYRGPFTYFDVEINNTYYREVMDIDDRLSSKSETERNSVKARLSQHNIGSLFHLHHEFTDDRHHVMYFTIHDVLQGFHTHVVMRRKEYRKLNRRTSICVPEKINRECLNECVEHNLTKICRMPYSSRNVTECDVLNYPDAHIMNHEAYSTFNEGKCGCQPSCTIIKFTAFVDVIDKIEDEDEVMRLRFYFADNSHEVKTEDLVYDSTAFLNDIGGSLGVLVGFCALNVLEITEFITYLITTKRKYW